MKLVDRRAPAPGRHRSGSLDVAFGVPDGTMAYGWSLASRIGAALERWRSEPVRPNVHAVVARLGAPLVLGETIEPSAPVAVGDGWVHVDVVDDEDHATFESLLDGGGDDPELLARLAQSCRLPVTPYRPAWPDLLARSGSGDGSVDRRRAEPDRALEDCLVVDLSSMWAGPLATSLLAEIGVRIVRIECPARGDAMTSVPALRASLGVGVEAWSLDLRMSDDRARFERLVEDADLVVESFSRRVMGNLGYRPEQLRRIRPEVSTLSIKAFDRGTDEAEWVAYGSGVHASSGLGLVDGAPHPARYSYLDPLCGFHAAALALDVLSSDRGGRDVEATLAVAAQGVHRHRAGGVASLPTPVDPAVRCSPPFLRADLDRPVWGPS